MLAQLALDPRPHAREALLIEYWPNDDPSRARVSLRQALSMIRKAIPEPDKLLAGDDMVQLVDVDTDVAEFRRRTLSAVAAPERDRARTLQETLDMYAEPLPDWDEQWVSDLRAQLASEALDLAIQLSALLAPTDQASALMWAQRALDIDPEDEEALALLDSLEKSPSQDLSRFRRRSWPSTSSKHHSPIQGAAELERVIQLYLHQDSGRALEMLSSNDEVLVNLGFRRVLPLYQQASRMVTPQSDLYGRLMGALGHIYHRLGAYDRSTAILRDVIAWSRLRGQIQVEANALISLGLIGLERGQASPTHPVVMRLREIERQVPKSSIGVFSNSMEGVHRWHSGDPRSGWHFIRESIRRATGEGMSRVARCNLANLSLVSYEIGALEAMREFRTMSESVADSFGDRYLAYAIEYVIGVEFLLEKRYEDAVNQLLPLLNDPRRDMGRFHILICEAIGLAAALAGQMEISVDALARAYVHRRKQDHLPTVTERRHIRRAYGELERRLGMQELDRSLDIAIGNVDGSARKTS